MFGRVLLALVLAAGLVTGGALAVLRTDFVSNNLCGYAVANIEEATEARVKVARCTVDPARGQLVIEGLEAEAPDGRLKFSVARIFMQLVVRPLQQRVRLERLEVDHPDVEVTLGGPPSTRPKSDKCLPPKLTGFELGRVHIRKLAVHVTDPESGLSVDLPRSSAILRGAGTEARLQLEVHSGSVEIGERAAHLISAKVAAHVNLGGVGLVALDKADVIGAEASVFATGKLEDFCTPAIDTNVNVRVDDLGVLTDALLPHTLAGVKGSIATDASLEVVKNTVRLHGDVRTKDLALEGFSPGDVRARFDMTPKRLKVQKLQIGVGKAGEIGGTAELGIGDPDLPITADLQLKDMELAELLNKLGITGAWVVLRTNGKVQAKGTLNPLELNGNLGVDLAEFAIQDRRWEQRAKAKRTLEFGKGRLNASVNVNQQRVLMNKGTLEVEGSRLEVEGVFNTDFEKGLSLRGKADNFALDDFRGHLGTIPWKGRLGLAVTVNGQYNKPDIKAQVAGRNLHFLDLSLGDVAAQVHFNGMHLTFDDVHAKKDRSTYGGRVALDFNDPALPVDAHLELTDAYVHDLVDLAVNLVPTLSTMNDAKDVNGHVTGVLDAHGPVAGPEATASMDFDKVTLWGQTFEDGSAHFTLHGGEPQLIIDKFDLRHGEAWFKTAGTFGPQWALNVDSRTENFDLADLDSGAAAQLKGPLVANSHVRGVASHPLIDVDLTFKGGRAGKAAMGDGAMAMRIDGKDMTWRGTVGTHTLEGQGKLKDDFAYTSTLALKFPDLSDYFETFAPDAQLTGGAASALVQVHGSLLKWRQSAGSVTLSLLKFTRNGIAFTNDGNGELLFGPAGLDIQHLALRSEYSRATLQGTRTNDGRLNVHCAANIDGRVLQALVPDLEHGAGEFILNAQITGTAEAPNLLGTLRVENGELRLRGLPLSLRELNGGLTFSQDALVIDQMTGSVNNGSATLSGGLQMTHLSPEHVDFSLKMSDVTVKVQDNLNVTIDNATLRLEGPPLEPTITGGVYLSHMKYAEDLDIERSMLDFNKRPPTPKVLTKSAVLVHYDFDVHFSKAMRVENNLARTDLKGDLHVTGNSRKMGLLGSINTVRGTAQFRDNEFTIEQGVVSFTDRQKLRPSFDFQAVAQVKDYKVRLHAYGNTEDPKVTLTSIPALGEADLGFLLTFGFVSQNLQQANFNAQNSGLAIGVEALNKATGFSDEVRKLIPKNDILRDPTIDFVSDFSQASGGAQLEPMARFRSHVVSDKLDLRLMEGVTTRRYRGVFSYQINDIWSAQFQIDNEKKNVGTDLGVDVKSHVEGDF